MSKFKSLLKEALGTISEQEAVDPALQMDPAAMAPPPPAGPGVQSDAEKIEEPEETSLRQEEIYLVDLAKKLFVYGLNTDRSTIDDADYAKIIQKVTSSNADEIKAVMERLVRDNQVDTGL